MFQRLSKEEARKEVEKLIQNFKAHYEQYKQKEYKEESVRSEFIDKLFFLFGWDINNNDNLPEQYKEVIRQPNIKIEGKNKVPDYTFRIGTQKKFFIEAKKPAINIKDDPEPAYQLRNYAWNSEISISILTDFEEFAIYDCRIKPNQNDNSSVARIEYIQYGDYLNKFDYLWSILSREQVWFGNLDIFIESSKNQKGTSEVGTEFLKEINNWRESLAKNIAIRNTDLSIAELNYAIQRIIDRILFLTFCEHRNIERYGRLGEIAGKDDVYKKLLPYFKDADDKYNSGIFDFKTDNITATIKIDDKVLKDIIVNLYYPKSPYDFSVIPIEILGKVYEQFLGKTVRLTESHQAKVEEKLEVRKAGGVYYTPEFIVDYIIEKTVGKLINEKSPKDIEKIKILDPACGSGTFLVRAYNYLLEYHIGYYKNNPSKYKNKICIGNDGNYLLTTEIKKKILINNIFGVDIDPQAVEITKLSLLLKVLENETKEQVEQQLKLFRERALPNIDKNIRCGNSVVNSSYFSQKTLEPNKDLSKINPFDWDNKDKGFGEILAKGGFDIIVGNPPYVKEYTDKDIFEPVKRTEMIKYYQGKMDFWYFFTCNALDLLKEGGLHSFIAPSNWITNAGASILRDKILSESKIISFFDFNDFKVFKDASIQTMVFVIEKNVPARNYSVDYYKLLDKNISKAHLAGYLLTGKDGNKTEHFKAKINPKELIGKTITFINSQFNDLLDRIKEKGEYYLTNDNVAQGIVCPQEFVIDSHIKELGDSIQKGDGIFTLKSNEINKFKLTQKEKEIIKPFYTTGELFRYYGSSKNNLWVIYSDMEVRKNIKDYPHIKEHLDRFRKVITSDFAPYGLHRAREQDFFEGEKIISLRKTSKPYFTYTDFSCYVSQTYFVIKPKDINLKYLTGLLNSSLIFFWLKFKGKKQGEQLQIDKAPLLEIPLYKPEENNKEEIKIQNEIIRLVDLIRDHSKKLPEIRLESEKDLINKQISAYEKQIDKLIYSLYHITDNEDTNLIEDSLK